MTTGTGVHHVSRAANPLNSPSIRASISSPHIDAHDELLKSMLKCPDRIPLDHVTLEKPWFLGVIDHDQVEDSPPAMVGRGADGHALPIQEGEYGYDTPDSVSLRASPHPQELVVKGDVKPVEYSLPVSPPFQTRRLWA